jgi:membrane-associated phospholipid phosphatase
MTENTIFNRSLFTKKDIRLTTLFSLLYLLVSYLLIGFKTDQVFLILICTGFYYFSVQTRKFIIGFSIFIVFWIIFDYLKAFPNYKYNSVHITDLYAWEKQWFGFVSDGTLVTPNEYWLKNSRIFLDIMSGLFYLLWVPVPIVFSVFLFLTNRKRQFLYFLLTFLLVNLLGFVGYYLYPAAPPWYLQQYGTEFLENTPSNPAQLIKFDQFFNLPVFQTLYSKGSNVFAAMPSLHSSYPLIVIYYGIKNRLGKINIFFAVVVVGIWFAAVYTSHHYVLDVLAGILTAVIGNLLFNRLKEIRIVKAFIERMLKAIS